MTPSRSRPSSKKNPRLHPYRAHRRRHFLESLEPRCLLASLAGEVFLDANGDGLRGGQEIGAANVRVYLDTNNNAVLDSGELSTATNDQGHYQFSNLSPGPYAVRIVTTDTAQSSPTSYFGSGYTALGGGTGTNPTQLFEMSLSGEVMPIGSPTGDRIHGLVRTNNGTFFGVNYETDGIYTIDPVTGQETLLSSPGVELAAGLAYDPGTDTIYTVMEQNGLYELKTVDQVSGQLGAPPVAVAPDVRAINFGSTFYDFDTATQTAVAVPRQTLSPFASTLDVRSDGAIFGLQGNALNQYSFPIAGSTATTLSTLSESIEAISFDASDRLFGVSAVNSTLHQIDPATGVVGPGVAITFGGTSISGITGFDIAPDGTHYLVDSTYLYTFDPTTGVATQAPNRALPPFSPIFTSLSAAADGSLFATLFNTTTPLAQIDPVTGLATALGDDPLGAPYASVVVGSPATGITASLPGISDLTFDTVGQRIVGFANGNDQFFEFRTDGVGSVLATAERPLESWSLAFNGSSFVMFDQDDPARTATVTVNPDTGAISPGFTASQRIPAEALFHAKTGNAAQRVTLGVSDLVGVDFGVLVNQPTGVEQRDSGFYINELMVDPLFGNLDTDQYVELRGPAAGQLPANSYLVVVDEDDSNRGEIHGIFDLSDQAFGANGFLVLLQQDNAYTVDPASAVLESTATGFGGLPGNLYTDSDPLSDRIDFIVGSNGFFLIESAVPPQLGDDIDVDDDGLADPSGIKANWKILDSVSLHPFVSNSSQGYGDIVLRELGPGSVPLAAAPGVVVDGKGHSYAGRIGDSIGSSADDWVFGTAIAAQTDPVTNRTTLYELESGIFGVPVPTAFNGRDLDHIGASNFNGGVHGTVTLFAAQGTTDANGDPLPPTPGAGITIFADLNNNGQQNLVNYFVDPNNGIDPTNLFDANGNAIPQVITNVFPGMTVTTADASNNIIGFDVTAELETNNFQTQNNRIFAHGGIDFFTSGQRLRFDLYRPANEVSIQAIGSEIGFSATYGRLEAYNAQDQLIGFAVSNVLISNFRETITVSSVQEDIAYAVAYSDDIGSPFGRFDNFAYRQSEASAITDAQGNYEIKHLFPGDYQVRLLPGGQSDGLIGGTPRPVVVTSHENYEIDFTLRPNVGPTTDPSFSFTIAENSPPGSSVGFVTGNDLDAQALKYSLDSGAEFGLLIDEDTGELTVGPNADLNFEADSQYLLTVVISDQFDLTATTQVTVNLSDLNEPPVAELGTFAVAEGSVNGTVVGQIHAPDPDVAQNQTVTFEVIGGSGAGIFAVNPANGLITLTDADAIDFETIDELSVLVRIFDSFNPPAEVTIELFIQVVDQNDRPIVITNSILVPENSDGVVGKIEIDDADVGQSHLFQLVGGSGVDLFRLRPTERSKCDRASESISRPVTATLWT